MKPLLCILLVAIAFGACAPESPVVPTNNLTAVWSKDNPTGELAGTARPVIYLDKAVYMWHNSLASKRPMQAYDKANGDLVWEWDDYFEDDNAYVNFNDPVWQRGNILVFALSRGVYAINLDNGETLWRVQMERSRGVIQGMGSSFFCVSHTPDRLNYYVLRGDVYSGVIDTVYHEVQVGGNVPLISPPQYYINENSDTMLVFNGGTYDFDVGSSSAVGYLYFYNLSADSLASKISYNGNTTSPTGFRVNGTNIYLSGPQMSCFDGNTFERKWNKPIPGGSGFIGAIFHNGNFYYGSEGTDQLLFCVDPETGQEKWRAESAGSCGWMSVYNDVIYYNGCSDGKLHCVDSNTGEVLGLFESPDVAQNSNAFFDRGLSIDPTTGRIYTGNYIKAYCFEPIR